MTQTAYKTVFGSLDQYEKGGVQLIDDKVTNYAFSNCFEIVGGQWQELVMNNKLISVKIIRV